MIAKAKSIVEAYDPDIVFIWGREDVVNKFADSIREGKTVCWMFPHNENGNENDKSGFFYRPLYNLEFIVATHSKLDETWEDRQVIMDSMTAIARSIVAGFRDDTSAINRDVPQYTITPDKFNMFDANMDGVGL